MAKTYDIVIDGKTCMAEHGEYLWDVAKRNGIEIPALCRSEAFPEHRASCRVCIVEVVARGRSKVVTSCVYPIEGECEVHTNSPRILQDRKVLMALLAARAPESDLMAAMASHMGAGEGYERSSLWTRVSASCAGCACRHARAWEQVPSPRSIAASTRR